MPATWTVADTLDTQAQLEVDRLVAAVGRRTGDEPFTEAQQDRLDAGSPMRHFLRRTDGTVTGYAVASIDSVIDAEPALGTFDAGLALLLEALGTPVSLLLRSPSGETVEGLLARGWRPSRTLHRMQRALPAEPPAAVSVTVRSFVVGSDEERWIVQNNRAFKNHPSQGHMTVEKLQAREASAWFDPNGFRLYLDGNELVASCWTKVHHTPDGDVGEIYVVSVDPDAQGRGLGRFAVLEGLSWLASTGITHAELYVEASNTAAVALYEALGFATVSDVVELRWDGQLAPTARPTP